MSIKLKKITYPYGDVVYKFDTYDSRASALVAHLLPHVHAVIGEADFEKLEVLAELHNLDILVTETKP